MNSRWRLWVLVATIVSAAMVHALLAATSLPSLRAAIARSADVPLASQIVAHPAWGWAVAAALVGSMLAMAAIYRQQPTSRFWGLVIIAALGGLACAYTGWSSNAAYRAGQVSK